MAQHEDKKFFLSWNDINRYVNTLVDIVEGDGAVFDTVIGIGKGGLIPGVMLCHRFKNAPNFYNFGISSRNEQGDKTSSPITQYPRPVGRTLIVDDINDSGNTFKFVDRYCKYFFDLSEYQFCSLLRRSNSDYQEDYTAYVINSDKWVVFPWEAC